MRNLQERAASEQAAPPSAAPPINTLTYSSDNPQNPVANSSNPNQPAAIKGPWGLDMKRLGKLNSSPINPASPIANALSKSMIGRVIL
jgi:hypothetical protein